MCVVVATLLVSALAGVFGCATDTDSGSSAEPTSGPAAARTLEPTATPTPEPPVAPTPVPTTAPIVERTETLSPEPTEAPTAEPTETPTAEPTEMPTPEPTAGSTPEPVATPAAEPATTPTPKPTASPTPAPRGQVQAEKLSIVEDLSLPTDCGSSIESVGKGAVVVGRLQWSPDGSQILVPSGFYEHETPVDVVEADGSRLSRLWGVNDVTGDLASGYAGPMSTFDLSADGSKIVYSTLRVRRFLERGIRDNGIQHRRHGYEEADGELRCRALPGMVAGRDSRGVRLASCTQNIHGGDGRVDIRPRLYRSSGRSDSTGLVS